MIPSFTANSIRERNQDGDMIEEPVDSEVSLGGEYEFNGNNFRDSLSIPIFLKLEADQEARIDVNSTTALKKI